MEHEKNPHNEYADWKVPEESNTEQAHGEDYESPEDTFKRYQKNLALDEASLAGKEVLDVGSGGSLFGKYLEQKYPGTHVVGIDSADIEGITVRASSEQLPFGNDSFDEIVAHGLQFDDEELENSMKEFIRVVRKSGEIRVGPLPAGSNGDHSEKRWNKVHELINTYKAKGITVEDVIVGQWNINDGPVTKYCIVVRKSK